MKTETIACLCDDVPHFSIPFPAKSDNCYLFLKKKTKQNKKKLKLNKN